MKTDILFSQVREDPTIDLECVDITAKNMSRKINTHIITSGGCTALNLLPSENIHTLTSFDGNIAQNKLLNLKIAFLNSLNKQDYIDAISGKNSIAFYNLVSNTLSLASREFWNNRQDDISFGINRIGTFENLFRDLSKRLRSISTDFFSIDLQNADHLKLWEEAFQTVFNHKKLALEYGENAVNFSMEKPFSKHFSDVFKKAQNKYRGKKNYFLDQILFDSYINEAPDYIQNWKNNSETKLITKTGHFINHLQNTPDHSIDFIQLSNITDWMPLNDANSIFVILKKKLAKGGGILCRRLNGDHHLETELAKYFATDKNTNQRLLEMDRSFFYSEVVFGLNN